MIYLKRSANVRLPLGGAPASSCLPPYCSINRVNTERRWANGSPDTYGYYRSHQGPYGEVAGAFVVVQVRYTAETSRNSSWAVVSARYERYKRRVQCRPLATYCEGIRKEDAGRRLSLPPLQRFSRDSAYNCAQTNHAETPLFWAARLLSVLIVLKAVVFHVFCLITVPVVFHRLSDSVLSSSARLVCLATTSHLMMLLGLMLVSTKLGVPCGDWRV